MTADEAALVGALKAGDPEARNQLVKLFREQLFRFLAVYLGDDVEAEDLTQLVLLRALKGIGGFQGRSRLRTWLMRITVNLARTHLKKKSRRIEQTAPVSLDGLSHTRHTVLSSMARRELVATIALAIDRLTPAMREAFVLHHVEGVPYSEMSVITGVGENALHARTHRARRLLRQQLGTKVDSLWLQSTRL